jgi:hypothetical protein
MKNLIIIVLLVLVLVMFFSNLRKAKEVFDETKKRIKHQMDLANLLESEAPSSTESNITGSTIGQENIPAGNETLSPAVV